MVDLPVPLDRAIDRLRDGALNRGYIRGIETASRLGRRLPVADPARHGVRVIRNVPYVDDGHPGHLLDIWLPRARRGLAPVVLYIHGGAFHYLSKDTHWLMGLVFARRGYVVFNINYRRAPRHRFPVPLEDVAKAAVWVKRNAERYGGDADRIAVAGESAGGNLATSLVLASVSNRPEPFAKELHEVGFDPKVCLPACGILQVSDVARFWERRRLPSWVRGQLQEIETGYLPRGPMAAEQLELANPLLTLENGPELSRPLPPFFSIVGTRDPIMEDTTRLDAALKSLGVQSDLRVYRGEIHAFHAIWNRPAAQDAWAGQISFLRRHL